MVPKAASKFITISQVQYETSRSDIEFFFKVLKKISLVDSIKQKDAGVPKYFSYKFQAIFVTLFPENIIFFRQIAKFIMLSMIRIKNHKNFKLKY